MGLKQFLRDVPFKKISYAIDRLRRRFATVPWNTAHPEYVVSVPDDVAFDDAVAGLDRYLRDVHYMGGAPYSYRYRGEVLNLRRPHGYTAGGLPREEHVRARETEDGDLAVIAHEEPNRYEAKEAHVHHRELEIWTAKRVGDTFDLDRFEDELGNPADD